MLKKRAVSTVMLVSCAMIWGSSYVAQMIGTQEIGPFSFIASRYVISVAVLTLFLAVLQKRAKRRTYASRHAEWAKRAKFTATLRRGAICGAALFTGSMLQLIGMMQTTTGKAAFITATFIVIVPIYSAFGGKRPSRSALISIFMSMGGLYLLSIKENFSVGRGDLLIFLSAFFWAAHIMLCAAFSRKSDPIKLSAVQFGVVALLSLAGALILEKPSLASVAASWAPIVYAGLFCTCVAYTFQMAAQRYVSPLATSIIMSTESIFAAIFGYFVFAEVLSARELVGCAALFAATLIAQLDDIKK